MKNLFKHIGIVALTAVIGLSMAACGDGGGLPPAGNGAIDLSTGGQDNWQVYNIDTGTALSSTVTFTQFWDMWDQSKTLSSCFSAGNYAVQMTSGKLSLKLGTPTSGSIDEPPYGLSATEGLEIFGIMSFTSSSKGLYWVNIQGQTQVMFVYANMDGTVSGTMEGTAINWNLKSGWNTVLSKYRNNYLISSVTGAPGSGFDWYYEN